MPMVALAEGNAQTTREADENGTSEVVTPILSCERYPLSVILSFLEECDGSSLLLTNKLWTTKVLPLFRVRQPLSVKGAKRRHRFQEIPVQDAAVRLDQLNTRRIFARHCKRAVYNRTTRELAEEEGAGIMSTVQDSPLPPAALLFRFLKSSSDGVFAQGLTLLASYPRSGNTLLRSLLEGITGVVTGSDTRPDRTLSRALADLHGLVGEGICDRKQVAFCKTHWPERIGCMGYKVRRAVLLVRNPFDAIDSYWNLCCTNTHTEKVTEDVYLQFFDFYQDLVKNEMKVWCEFHKFWLDLVSMQIPVLLVRYEDLITNPQSELSRILNFSSATSQPDGIWDKRIEHVLKNKSHYGYKATGNGGDKPKFGRSLGRFSEGFLQELHDIAENITDDDLLRRFGYHVFEQGFPEELQGGGTQTLKPVCFQPLFVNDKSIDLRAKDCKYGRRMRDWRRRHTSDDQNPFPVVERTSSR